MRQRYEFGEFSLYLYHMKATRLQAAALHPESIRVLQLRNTTTRGLDSLLPKLRGLTHMALEHCRLTSLPDAIAYCTQLEQLSLAGNQLETISPALAACPRLRVLDVSGNRLSVWPEELGECRQLRELNLGRNAFTRIPDGLCRLPWLARLNMAHNRVQAFPELPPPALLEQLNLSHNHIEELPSAWLGLPRLTSLDISANPCLRHPALMDELLAAQALTRLRGPEPQLNKKLLAFLAALRKTRPRPPHIRRLFAATCGDEGALSTLSQMDCLRALSIPWPALRNVLHQYMCGQNVIPGGARVALMGKLPFSSAALKVLADRLSFSLSGIATADVILLGGPPYRIPEALPTGVRFVYYRGLWASAQATVLLDAPRLEKLRHLLTHALPANRQLALSILESTGIPEALLTATLYAWQRTAEPKLKSRLWAMLLRYVPEKDQHVLRSPLAVWRSNEPFLRRKRFEQAFQGTLFDSGELCGLIEQDDYE
jgi:hypothetical protein